MTTLQIGRWGVDVVLDGIEKWRDQSSANGQTVQISGDIVTSTLVLMQAARTELLEQIGSVIAVTWSQDSTRDGFYFLESANVDLRFLSDNGLASFRILLKRIGDHSTVEFISNFTGLLIANSHGLTEGEVTFAHAPPVDGADAYFAGGATTATARTTEDGDIPVFLDIPLTDKIGSARWGCAPANYYKGAARIDVNGFTRTGKSAPMTPDSFVIGNGLIELRAEESGDVTIGDIAIRAYNGSWGSWIPFDIVYDTTDDIPEWHLFNIIRNDPSAVIVQLVRDSDEVIPTDKRHWLTFTLRRGMPFVRCHYTYSSSIRLAVNRATTDTGVSVTPTGASSAMAVRDSANDGDGNRWVIAAAGALTIDTTNGGLDMTTIAASHSFILGFEIDGSSADGNNDADALCLQYLADLTENVQATIR